MAITVKYRHGDLEYSRIGGSASQVRQVLETIQEDLVARCGQYTSRQKGDDVLKKRTAHCLNCGGDSGVESGAKNSRA